MLFDQSILLLALPVLASGHGYMFEPPSRNWHTHTDGLDWGTMPGVPAKEYCPHCVNRNTGVCGRSESDTDYDDWRDSEGKEMPWIQLETYSRGQTIMVMTHLAAHHGGHMELRGCPDGKASTQECFDSHVFEFVEDTAFGMPRDPNHPERGYYWGGPTQNGLDFAMKFKIPDSLVGENVLLQWLYVTANSCTPEGYSSYYGGNNSLGHALEASFWSSALSPCTGSGAAFMPLAAGEITGRFGEQFVNCAEVAILDGPTSTIPSPVAPARPTGGSTDPPTKTPSKGPTPAPVQVPITAAPVPAPTTIPIPVPTSSSRSFCCSNNFKDCNVSGWCGESQSHCETQCGAFWIEANSCNGIAQWGECTKNTNACCGPATCQGNEWYKQCK